MVLLPSRAPRLGPVLRSVCSRKLLLGPTSHTKDHRTCRDEEGGAGGFPTNPTWARPCRDKKRHSSEAHLAAMLSSQLRIWGLCPSGEFLATFCRHGKCMGCLVPPRPLSTEPLSLTGLINGVQYIFPVLNLHSQLGRSTAAFWQGHPHTGMYTSTWVVV